MGLFDFLKKKDQPAGPSLPIIKGIQFGGAVRIEPLAVKLLGPDHGLFGQVPESLIVTGQSTIQFEDGMTLHRFYNDDDHMLQIMGGDGIDEQDVDQVSYFIPVDSWVPAPSDLSQTLRVMRQARYEYAGHTYQRLWADGDGEADLVELYETIHLSADGSKTYDIAQACMLFTRDVGETEESLLVIHEKQDDGSSSISIMLGAVLSSSDIFI